MVTRGRSEISLDTWRAIKPPSKLDPKTPVSSSEQDLNSSGALLDYEGAEHYRTDGAHRPRRTAQPA